MKTKPLIIIALAVAFMAVVLFGPEGRMAKTAPKDSMAPDFELNDRAGKIERLKDMQGSVVLINFWATWCESCKQEMPYLQNLYNMKKDSPDFRIITVLYKDTAENAEMYLRQRGYSLPFIIDVDGLVSKAYGLTGVPETFIIDKKGVIREKIIGPAHFDSPKAISYYRKLIEE